MEYKSFYIPLGLLAMSLLICLSLHGQNREPQHVFRVTVNSRYVLKDGNRTSEFFAIGQHISDSLGRMHTEIDWDWDTHYPSNYRWHYFEGQTKYKTDFFINEKLARIEEYRWNDNGKLVELNVKNVNLPDTTFIVRVKNAYNPNGTIKQSIGYDAKGKKAYTTKHKYDAKGTEIERKVKGKRANPPDSILFLSRVPLYDSLARIVEETITTDKIGKGKSSKKYSYIFDTNGNLTNYSEFDMAGKLLTRKEFTYRKDNRIQQMKRFDANGNLVDWQAWRYEIYKTNDRRQRVLE